MPNISHNWNRQFEPLILLKRVLKLGATLLFAISLFVIYLIFTQQGTELIINLISELTPFKIQYSKLTGCLVSFEMEDVRLESPKIDFNAAQLSLNLDLIDLLRADKKIESIKAKDVTLIYKKEKYHLIIPEHLALSALQQAIEKVSLPINVENIHLQEINIHWQDQQHHLSELFVKGGSNATIEEIHYQGDAGTLHAQLRSTIKVDWDLKLTQINHPITTKGKIFLPLGRWDDPHNQIQMDLQAKELSFASHPLTNVILNLQGTPLNHSLTLKGAIYNTPVKAKVKGQLSSQHWKGNVDHLSVDHKHLSKLGQSRANLDIDWQTSVVNTHLELFLGESFPLHLQAKMNKNKPYDLMGNAQSHLTNIKPLVALFPELKHLQGQLDVDLKLGGTLFHPQVTGNATLTKSKIRVTSLGSQAFVNQLQLQFLPDGQVISGKGSWGNGTFSLNGKGSLLQSNPNLSLHLKGENLLLSNTSEYHIVANPTLTLSLKNNERVLEGKIFIPQAEIQSLKNLNRNGPSDDVVIVSKKKPMNPSLNERIFTTQLKTNIELILGDKITYKGHGFSSQVSGKMQIQQQPGQIPNAKGKLVLKKGKYRAYGKIFDLAYGQILFTGGPINDPILDIRAQRVISPSNIHSAQNNQPIVAGVKFGGPLKNFKLSFYSTPPMPESDVLSYLIIGRPQKQMNDAQAEILFQALSQLTNMVGNNRSDVQFDLAEKLKLDQLGFAKKSDSLSKPGQNPLEDTLFVLGKQLSERLYLNYSVGLLDSASQFGFRYALGKNVTIEAATGTQASSADVVLSFED